MDHLARISVLTVSILAAHAPLSGQARAPDSTDAPVAALAGCYRFVGEVPTRLPEVPMPKRLVLTKERSRVLSGYVHYFRVRPYHLEPDSYVIWRAVGTDSLQIDLQARPEGPPAYVISGQVRADTLTGEIVHWQLDQHNSSHFHWDTLTGQIVYWNLDPRKDAQVSVRLFSMPVASVVAVREACQ